MAACHWDKVRTRDLRAMYNLMPLADFEASAPALPFRHLAGGARGARASAVGELVVTQPSFFTDVAGLLTARAPAGLAVLGRVEPRVVLALAVPRPLRSCRSASASTGRSSRAPRCSRSGGSAASTSSRGPSARRSASVYVERHFSPVAKERMDVLVANLIEAYRQLHLRALAWMTDETKERALDKLAKFRPKIGFPSAVARLQHARDRPRRPAGQRRPGDGVRARSATSPRSENRSTARSGS